MKLYFILLFFLSSTVLAKDFEDLVKMIESHPLIQASESKVKADFEFAKQQGSFPDPVLSLKAVNYPIESLKNDESMMTGLQIGISQKVSLSGNYGFKERALKEQAKLSQIQTQYLKKELLKNLWVLSIDKRKIMKARDIFKENLDWIEDNLKLTKRLYETGKVPQVAVLEMQIQKSELVSKINEFEIELSSIRNQIGLLLGQKEIIELNLKSVPWDMLKKWDTGNEGYDLELKSLKENLVAKELIVSAKSREIIPDINLGISYTKRNDIDGLGDFIGASISFGIPISSSKYAAKKESVFQKVKAQKSLKNYELTRHHKLEKIKLTIQSLNKQLNILQGQTLTYSKNSRDITLKSYARAAVSYQQLLESQIQYQKYLLQQVQLEANADKMKLEYMFINSSLFKEKN